MPGPERVGRFPTRRPFQLTPSQPAGVNYGDIAVGDRDPHSSLATIVGALGQTGQRAVVAAGWGGLQAEGLPDEVLAVRSAPHHWLFPRVSAVVHHGGAGTTAAGLRAGKPALIVPHMADQPFWGRRVHELGAGVRPVPRHKLTTAALAEALDRLARDTRLRDNAEALGEKIRAERGVEAAVAAIERSSG